MMVLEPTKRADRCKKSEDGQWQREGRPPLYLAATEDRAGSDAGRPQNSATPAQDPYDDGYDFM